MPWITRGVLIMVEAQVHSARVLGCALAITALLALSGCTSPPDEDASTASPSTHSAVPLTDEELATAVVRIAPADAAGNECWWGSGSVVSPEGTILTNFHVIENDPTACLYEQLIISTTDSADAPPTPTYLGRVHAFDAALDLAVVRIASGLHGEEVTPDLAALTLGDSDAVQFGDAIRVLGYPSLGGDTITLTDGTVSGFLSSPDVAGGRAWVKTATSISGGNSGGAAVDGSGALIGVPTRAAPGNTDHAVDCRIIEDTNADGVVDGNDTCVPVGGFINGIRPVNLAAPLLDRAANAGPIDIANLVREPAAVVTDSPSTEPSEQPGDTPAEGPTISALRFASDIDENGIPVDEVVTLPSGTSSVCASFDYSGMVDGATYDLIWTLDGQLQDAASVRGDTWSGGPQGSWYICARGDMDGLDEGLWELAVYADSEQPYRTGSIFVGDGHPQVDVEITNGLDERICYLKVTPDESDWWGPDRLGSEYLDPGQSVTVSVGASAYDAQGLDCDGNELVRVDDVDVQESATILLQ